MLQIKVCVGSSCYLQGSYEVIKALQAVIDELGIQDAVELQAGFCLGRCTQGVVMQVGERILLGVTPEQVREVVMEHILPEVR
jgi:NADH:ubiquinone oxidoreductase subunit E